MPCVGMDGCKALGEVVSDTQKHNEPIPRTSYSYLHKETLPESNSQIYNAAPYVRIEFEVSSNPYLRLQMADLHKTEAQRREEATERGSSMVTKDKADPVFRPPQEFSEDVDRANFNSRWINELRSAVLSAATEIKKDDYRSRSQTKHIDLKSDHPDSSQNQREDPMVQHVEYNDGNLVHLSKVKRIQPITEKERDSLASLGKNVDADKFSTRIDNSDGTKTYAHETIDELASQGIDLVKVDENAFVPKDNILKAKRISEKDRNSFAQRTGRPLANKFQTQIDTSAGRVLSSLEPTAVMKEMGRSYQPQTVMPDNMKSQSMAEQRDAVISKASPQPQHNGRAPTYER